MSSGGRDSPCLNDMLVINTSTFPCKATACLLQTQHAIWTSHATATKSSQRKHKHTCTQSHTRAHTRRRTREVQSNVVLANDAHHQSQRVHAAAASRPFTPVGSSTETTVLHSLFLLRSLARPDSQHATVSVYFLSDQAMQRIEKALRLKGSEHVSSPSRWLLKSSARCAMENPANQSGRTRIPRGVASLLCMQIPYGGGPDAERRAGQSNQWQDAV